MSALVAKAWRDHRQTLIGFGIGLVLVELLYIAFYPSIRTSAADLQAYMDKLPPAFRELFGDNFASPEGYLRGQLFGELGPILFLVVAIGAGARTIAGEEEARTLDLLLVTPVRRSQLLMSKAIALTGLIFTLGALTFATVLVLGPPFGLHAPVVHVASASLTLTLLSVSFAAVALAVGASTGHRGTAIAVTSALAVGMYVLNALGIAVDAMEPLRPLSLFRWYTSPPLVAGGIEPRNVVVFLAVTALAYAAAHIRFERRDLAA